MPVIGPAKSPGSDLSRRMDFTAMKKEKVQRLPDQKYPCGIYRSRPIGPLMKNIILWIAATTGVLVIMYLAVFNK